MTVKITPLPDGRFSVAFPYDELSLSRIKALPERLWNPADQRWELPVAHLGAVMDIFRIAPTQVDRKLNRAYQMHRIRTARARIEGGNLTATLIGTKLPLEKIDAATSFFVPGYRFMPRFRSGHWDGRKHLFDDIKGIFPAGLLRRVLAIMQASGIECDLNQLPAVPQPPILPTAPDKPVKTRTGRGTRPFVLRDYQKECISAALTGKRGVLELATGGGKTAIAAHIIREINQPAIFLVHTRDLLHQTRRVLTEMLGIPIGQAGDGLVKIEPVTVATVQTCARAMELKITPTEDDEKLEKDKTDLKNTAQDLRDYLHTVPVAFFDECHHLPAETTYDLAMVLESAAWRFGLSATPYRADRQDLLLEAALGPKLYSCRASVLIEKGYLVAPRIIFRPVPSLIVSSGKAEYPQVFQDYIVDNPRRNAMIVEAAEDLAAGGKSVLILVSQVRHGENLRLLMPHVPLVQGSDPSEKRQEIFAQLAAKTTSVVIATTLADEGLDVPSLNSVILASAGRSETRALQRVGRALRPAPGKKRADVVDFLDHAPFLKEHAQRRLDIFRSEPKFEVKVLK